MKAGSYNDANNDLGGVYNFDNAIQCCAKVFAEGGDAFEYYLNESKDLVSTIPSNPFSLANIMQK